MTPKIPGKLKSDCPDFPQSCDVCGKNRSRGNHQRCSKIRQQRHQQAILNDEFDRMLMFDKKEPPP